MKEASSAIPTPNLIYIVIIERLRSWQGKMLLQCFWDSWDPSIAKLMFWLLVREASTHFADMRVCSDVFLRCVLRLLHIDIHNDRVVSLAFCVQVKHLECLLSVRLSLRNSRIELRWFLIMDETLNFFDLCIAQLTF